MADRTVAVRLVLNAQGYAQGVDEVAKKTAAAGTEVEKLAQKRQAFTQLGAAAIGMGAAFGLGVGVAVSKFAEFDQQMSYVQAATHETAGNMTLLRDAALEAGARTVYSATEAAGAIEELSRAGVATADILGGGLDAALDLAAAGNLGVAEAAGIAATALKTFNLRGEDMSHVADLLAAGAGKAMGDVSQLAQALAQGGQVAKQTGLSIEETTAGLAAFAAQGLLGSDAGTSFKSMLQRLTPQSAEARREMDRLGISAYDSAGEFIGLANFAGNLQTALKDLTPEQRNAAMATIFGSDAVRAATVLYTEGANGISEWTDAVNDQGYAAETAAMRLDNLRGDLEALGGAFDTALIQSGSGANDALRGIVQSGTAAIDVFSSLPEPVQASAVYLGLAATTVGTLSGAALLGIPKITELRASLQATSYTLRGVGLAAGAATVGLGVVIGVVAALATQHAEAQAKARAYADTLEEGTNRLTKASRELAQENLAMERSWLFISRGSAYDAAEKLGLSLETVTDAATGNVAALRELEEVIRAGAGEQEAAQRVADRLGISLTDVSSASTLLAEAVLGENESIEQAIRVSEQKAKADREAADASGEHESALRALEGAAADVGQEVDDLAEAIRSFGEATLNTRDANRQFEQALDDLQESISENGSTLDVATEAGRANEESVDALVRKTLEYSASLLEETGSHAQANAVIAEGRQRLIEMLAQLGITGQAAEDYVNELGLIPGNVNTAVALTGVGAAEAALDQLARDRWARVHAVVVAPNTVDPGAVLRANGYASPNFTGNMYERGNVKAFAAGGFASGFYKGEVHKFAEDHLPWEAYISPDPRYKERNQAIVWESGRRLGMWEQAPQALAAPTVGQGPDLDALAARITTALMARPTLTIHNPVSRDARRDAYEAQQMLGG